jgi:3'-5' exoribonuclease
LSDHRLVATLPIIIPLHALKLREPAACFARLAEKQTKSTRDGQPFLVLTFRDRRKAMTSVVWSDAAMFRRIRDDWAVGGNYRLQGVLLEHDRYGPQFELRDGRDIRPTDAADGFDERELIDRSRFDSQVMFDELIELVDAEIGREPVQHLVKAILAEHAERLKVLPASRNRYHPFPGGWLEHTLSVVKTCRSLTDHYAVQFDELKPPLNRDLILAAAVLHEIGRVAEWSPGDVDQPIATSVPGHLHGAGILARDLIRTAAAAIPEFDAEFLLLLEHVILSYLTLPEWGSQRLPAIPEVLVLHHADDLDAKMEMYARSLTNDASDGPFTDRDPVLNKPLWKSRTQ